MRMSSADVQWGSVADWLSGVGSLGAVIVALGLALQESRRRRAAQADDERRQARLVVVGEPAFDRSETLEHPLSLYVRVHNYSDAPIHDLVVSLTTSDNAPISSGDRDAVSRLFVAPGEYAEAEFAYARYSDLPMVWFLDNQGVRWRREVGVEPLRILDYLDPMLPEDLQDMIRMQRGIPREPPRLRNALFEWPGPDRNDSI